MILENQLGIVCSGQRLIRPPAYARKDHPSLALKGYEEGPDVPTLLLSDKSSSRVGSISMEISQAKL